MSQPTAEPPFRGAPPAPALLRPLVGRPLLFGSMSFGPSPFARATLRLFPDALTIEGLGETRQVPILLVQSVGVQRRRAWSPLVLLLAGALAGLAVDRVDVSGAFLATLLVASVHFARLRACVQVFERDDRSCSLYVARIADALEFAEALEAAQLARLKTERPADLEATREKVREAAENRRHTNDPSFRIGGGGPSIHTIVILSGIYFSVVIPFFVYGEYQRAPRLGGLLVLIGASLAIPLIATLVAGRGR